MWGSSTNTPKLVIKVLPNNSKFTSHPTSSSTVCCHPYAVSPRKMTAENDGKKCFDSKLIDLIRGRNYEEMKSYLDNEPNLNDTTDSLRMSLLHLAVKYRNDLLTEYLIGRGCTIDRLDKNGETPLIMALKERCKYQVRSLLVANADFNAIDASGKTALSMIFELRHKEVVDLQILNLIIDKLLVMYGNEEQLAKTLIDARCPLDKVVYFNSPSLMKRLLEHGYEVNKQHHNNLNSTALHVAAMLNYPEVMRVLLQFGADVAITNEHGYVPISYYVERHSEQDPDLIEALMPRSFDWLNRKVKGFNKERLSLYYIFTKGTKETLRLFQDRYVIDYSATDKYGETPLYYLMTNKNHDILESFAITKLDVNMRDNLFKTTALHFVANLGDPVYMKFLLDKGAMVNAVDLFRRTPLLLSIEGIIEHDLDGGNSAELKNFEKCVEMLMLYGADAEVEKSLYCRTVLNVIRKAKIFNFIKSVLANVALLDISGRLQEERTLKEIYSDVELTAYYAICKQQLEETKMQYLHGAVTVYKILTEHEEKVALYTRGQNIDEFITNNFPLESYYKKLLHKRLSEAAKINKLKSNAARLLADITGWSDPSHLIIDKIICMLKISDLQGFMS